MGADAVIIVFDADTVSCRATYENPRQTSVGFRHVIVSGGFVLKDSELVLDSMPGRAVRRTRLKRDYQKPPSNRSTPRDRRSG